jgi:multicomponent Na+:H+ antiporter subunit E
VPAELVGELNLRIVGTIGVLFVLWLLMSGIFKPLVIGFGVGSVIVAIFVIRRMDAQDGDRVELRLSPLQTAKYLMWLMREIAKANWAVTKIILSRDMAIRQHLFTVPYTQKTDLAQVMFANSITLTPGTITVETEAGNFLVHAVAYSADDPAALADMDRRVSATELAHVS